MANPKTLSLIHMARGMALMGRMATEDGALEMVATYLAPASAIVASKENPDTMKPLIAQAAELPAMEAAEVLNDFFAQFKNYNEALKTSLPPPKRTIFAAPSPPPIPPRRPRLGPDRTVGPGRRRVAVRCPCAGDRGPGLD